MKVKIVSFKFLCALLAGLMCTPSSFAFDTQDLMNQLAQIKYGEVKFNETKYLAVLDRPIKSAGTLRFEAPATIEKITIEPEHESLLLLDKTLTIIRGGKKIVAQLDNYPQVLGFVEAIRGLLLGDQQLLEKGYKIQLNGSNVNWSLLLTPKEGRLSDVIKQVKVIGNLTQIHMIEYVQRDGDRSVMVIEQIPAPENPIKDDKSKTQS